LRVKFQGLRGHAMAATNIDVLKPTDADEYARKQREYLDRYYANMQLQGYL